MPCQGCAYPNSYDMARPPITIYQADTSGIQLLSSWAWPLINICCTSFSNFLDFHWKTMLSLRAYFAFFVLKFKCDNPMPTARIHLRVCKIKPTKLQRSCILTWWTLGRLFEGSSHAPPRLQLVHSTPPLLPAPVQSSPTVLEKYLSDSIPAAFEWAKKSRIWSGSLAERFEERELLF